MTRSEDRGVGFDAARRRTIGPATPPAFGDAYARGELTGSASNCGCRALVGSVSEGVSMVLWALVVVAMRSGSQMTLSHERE